MIRRLAAAVTLAARRIEREKYDRIRRQTTVDVVVSQELLGRIVDRWETGEFMLRPGADGRFVLVARTFDSIETVGDLDETPDPVAPAVPMEVYRAARCEDLASPDGHSFLCFAVPDDAFDVVRDALDDALEELR